MIYQALTLPNLQFYSLLQYIDTYVHHMLMRMSNMGLQCGTLENCVKVMYLYLKNRNWTHSRLCNIQYLYIYLSFYAYFYVPHVNWRYVFGR